MAALRYNNSMSQRLAQFRSYESHAWLKKVHSKLKAEDRRIAEEFIASHDGLDQGAFEMAVNRMFLDKPKPKRFGEILELLTCCNVTRAPGR